MWLMLNGEWVRLDKRNGRGFLNAPVEQSSGETQQAQEKFQARKPTEIQTLHLMNALLMPHRYANLLGRNMHVLVFILQ